MLFGVLRTLLYLAPWVSFRPCMGANHSVGIVVLQPGSSREDRSTQDRSNGSFGHTIGQQARALVK